MKTRKILSVLLIMILLVSLSPAALAAVEFASDEKSFTGEHNATVFLGGSNPVSEAAIRGILFTAGNTVTTSGSSEYAFVAGNALSFGTACTTDAFLAGNSVSISGSVGRDVLVMANSLNLSGSIGRDLYAGARTVSISGEIGGDVLIAAEEIRIADNARITGTLHYNSDAVVTGPTAIVSRAEAYSVGGEESNYSALISYIQEYGEILENRPAAESAPVAESAPAAESTPAVEGAAIESAAPAESAAPETTTTTTTTETSTTTTTTTTVNTPDPAASHAVSTGSSTASRIKSLVFSYVGLVLLAFALLWLTPLWEKLDSVYTGADFGRYAATFGIGLAVMVGLPIPAIILLFTGFGTRIGLVLIMLYIAAIAAAPVFLGFFVGVLIWRRLCKQPVNYWAELAIGILAWRLVSLIPVLKLATSLVTVPLALGVLTRLLGKKKADPAAPVLPEKSKAQKGKLQKV